MGYIRTSAGNATIAEVARHWSVDRDTAIRILKKNKVPFIDDDGPLQVAWTDVWLVEGSGYVAPASYADFKEPLLHVERLGIPPEKCRRPDIYMQKVKLKPSALRARVSKIQKPIVRLAERIQRVRPFDLEALLGKISK